MLVGGMDFSGNADSLDKFIAIVIGTEESISAIFDTVGYDHIHMRNIHNDKQNAIVSKLRFDGKNNIAFCIRIDRSMTTNQILTLRRIKKKISQMKKFFVHIIELYLETLQKDFNGLH